MTAPNQADSAERFASELIGLFADAILRQDVITHTDLTALIKARDAARLAKGDTFQCAARHSTPSEPAYANCEWPICGCDPKADKVIEALEERGCVINTSTPPQAVGDGALNKDGLRACPFCGSTRPHADYKTTFFGGLGHYAYCPECRTQGPTFNTDYNQNNSIDLGTAGAAKLWNTRAPSGEAVNQMMVEALAKIERMTNRTAQHGSNPSVNIIAKEALAAAKAVKPCKP